MRATVKTFLLVCIIATWAFLVRRMHLLEIEHYYLIGSDSYFFHWQTDQLLSGQTIPMVWHSGITYPLAYFAKAIAAVTGLSTAESLTEAAKLLPPLLGAATCGVMYLGVSRIYDRGVALWSAFAWATLPLAYNIQAAGYLDRDCLTVPLFLSGGLIYYLSSSWTVKFRGREVGWILASLALALVLFILFAEWLATGCLLLLSLLLALYATDAIRRLVRIVLPPKRARKTARPLEQGMPGALFKAANQANWRPLALLLALAAITAIIYPGIPAVLDDIHGSWAMLSSQGSRHISELRGLGLGDLLGPTFLLIPMLVGFYISGRRVRRADVFWWTWFLWFFIIAFFSYRRVYLFAMPPLCVMVGIGMTTIFDFGRSVGLAALARKVAAYALLVLLLMQSFIAYRVGSSYMAAADRGWYDALTYIRYNTPDDARVMTWWDRGYWVKDLARRPSVADNGFHTDTIDTDIAKVYAATDESEAIAIMQTYNADYVVFSTLEIKILRVISDFALGEVLGDGESIPDELRGSLYARSLDADFQSTHGLQTVYRSDEVVILRLSPEAR